LNRRINHVASEKFERILKDNLILNCPLTVADARRSQKIYGPPLPPIKGRTRYQQPARITDPTIIPIPLSMYEDLKNVTLCTDFHYVNGMTVFHSISRRISYRTVSFPLSRSKAAMVKEIKNVCRKYHRRGFKYHLLFSDHVSPCHNGWMMFIDRRTNIDTIMISFNNQHSCDLHYYLFSIFVFFVILFARMLLVYLQS